MWSDGTPASDLGEMSYVDGVLFSVLSNYSQELASVGMNFRDLNVVLAGEVHNRVGAWDVILQGYERRETIFKFICSGV